MPLRPDLEELLTRELQTGRVKVRHEMPGVVRDFVEDRLPDPEDIESAGRFRARITGLLAIAQNWENEIETARRLTPVYEDTGYAFGSSADAAVRKIKQTALEIADTERAWESR